MQQIPNTQVWCVSTAQASSVSCFVHRVFCCCAYGGRLVKWRILEKLALPQSFLYSGTWSEWDAGRAEVGREIKDVAFSLPPPILRPAAHFAVSSPKTLDPEKTEPACSRVKRTRLDVRCCYSLPQKYTMTSARSAASTARWKASKFPDPSRDSSLRAAARFVQLRPLCAFILSVGTADHTCYAALAYWLCIGIAKWDAVKESTPDFSSVKFRRSLWRILEVYGDNIPRKSLALVLKLV